MRKGDARLHDWINQWIRTNMDNGRLQAVFRNCHNAGLSPEVMEAAKRL